LPNIQLFGDAELDIVVLISHAVIVCICNTLEKSRPARDLYTPRRGEYKTARKDVKSKGRSVSSISHPDKQNDPFQLLLD
jgi:hypothetical protein